MPSPVYVDDSGGTTWEVTIDSGVLTVTSVGSLGAPRGVDLSSYDGGMANSWALGVEDGVLQATAIPYNFYLPNELPVQRDAGWVVKVGSDGVIAAGLGTLLECGLPYIDYPSVVTGLPFASTSPLRLRYRFRKVPWTVLTATRHDNRASSGVQEIVYERTDEFFEGAYEYLGRGAEAASWEVFMRRALQGETFDYHPTGCPLAFVTYTLDDTTWKPPYLYPEWYNFSIRFFRRIAWP